MHRFETMKGHSQYVNLSRVVAIDPSDNGKWCSLHLDGCVKMTVDATSDEVFGLIEENMSRRGLRWAGSPVVPQ
jgi:hypothetical protein